MNASVRPKRVAGEAAALAVTAASSGEEQSGEEQRLQEEKDPFFNLESWMNNKVFEKVRKWIINGGREDNEEQNSKDPRSTRMMAGAWTAIYMAREDMEKLKALYGTAYKWEFWKMKARGVPFETEGMLELADAAIQEGEELKKYKKSWQKGEGNVLAIPHGYEVVLLLKRFFEKKKKEGEQEDDWEDTVAIRRSVQRNGGLGVFAKRRFEKGNVVGLYMGEPVFTCSMVGGKEPAVEELEAAYKQATGAKLGEHQFLGVRNGAGKWTYLDAGKLEKGKKAHLFVGTHYMNDGTFGVDEFAPKALKKSRTSKQRNV